MPQLKGKKVREELKRHNTYQHANKQFNNLSRPPAMLLKIPSLDNNLPPGPPVRRRERGGSPPAAPRLESGQIGGFKRESSVLDPMEVFPCDECGVEVSSYEQLKEHMRKMHESPEKSFGSFGRVRDFGEQEQNKRKVPKFEDMDNLEFQDEDDLNDFDQNEEGHENPAFSGFDDESEDQSIHGEEIGAEYHDEINERFNGQFWDEEYDHEERQEEYYNEDDEYDIDEMEDNEIEVISSGVKNLPKFYNEIEVIEHNRNKINSLDSLKNCYSQITINRKDDSDDGSSYDEDNTDISEDEDVYQVPNPEEIALDDEPDEITLDEGEEDIEDVTTTQVVAKMKIWKKSDITRP